MEPTKPQPERAPMPVSPAESLPTPGGGEAAPATASSPSQTPASPAPLPPATPAAPAPSGSGTAPVASGAPTVAADVDVIEKEWVDKAEEVIKQTAGDPHAEEEAVEALQIDYLKKRYGKDVSAAKDE